MSNTPEFEPWAIEGMAREGLTPEEYCNVHAYNWEDIMVDDQYVINELQYFNHPVIAG